MSFDQLDGMEQKRLLDKLAKLKALSECPTGNVNETATAAATMMRIMLEYQIHVADLDLGAQSADNEVREESLTSQDSLNGFARWKRILAMALCKVNSCECYKSSQTDHTPWTRRTASRLVVIGTPSDIENTRKMYAFCTQEIERLCQDWGKGRPVKQKNDFKTGAAAGIANKVRTEREKVLAQELARVQGEADESAALQLFHRKEQAVEAYLKSLHLRSSTAYVRAPSQEAYRVGYQAGSSLDLSGSRTPRLSS